MGQLPETSFTVREPAWHGLSTVVQDNPRTAEEAQELAGALWEPQQAPNFTTKEYHACASKDGCQEPASAQVLTTKNERHYACGFHAGRAQQSDKVRKVEALALKQVPNFYTIMRSDNGEIIDVAPSTRQIYSNLATFELVEALLQSGDEQTPVAFETGGVLDNGGRVWALARVDDPLEVKGDPSPIYPYVSVLNSHNGTASLQALLTSIRIVCHNTWTAAENDAAKNKRQFKFRHTRNIEDNVERAKQVLFGARDEAREWVEYANKMIAIPMPDPILSNTLKRFIPIEPTMSDRAIQNVEEARAAVMRNYHSPSTAAVAGTMWGAVCAVGEYLDHGRRYRNRETYVQRAYMSTEDGKRKLLGILRDELSLTKELERV